MSNVTEIQVELFPLPKKRGRPPSGQALTNAEKQRAYRARLAEKQAGLVDYLAVNLYNERKDLEIRQLRDRIAELEAALSAQPKQARAPSASNVTKKLCHDILDVIDTAPKNFDPLGGHYRVVRRIKTIVESVLFPSRKH